MKIGTRVRVKRESNTYGGKYCNHVGYVESVYNGREGGKVGVKLDGMSNSNSGRGLFYFLESELDVLAVPSTDTYSFIKDQLNKRYGCPFTIKKVYFNDPVTVILWADGTKTIVRCGEDDIYDPEKGLAMAISKKALGNKGNYYNTFKKHLPEEEIDDESVSQFFADFFNSLFEK